MNPPISATSDETRLYQLERLLDVSVRLNSTLDLDTLLQHIIETAAELLDCEAASLLLFDEARRTLRFAAATGSDPDEIAKIPVPLAGSIAGRIYSENRTVVVEDVAQDRSHFKQVGDQVQFQTRSLLGVPMRIEGEPTGVLEALNKRSGPFTAADEEVLTIIAAHAALALRNARQLQAVQEAYDQLTEFDAFKSDFLALASHELRTPLTAVLQILELGVAEPDLPLGDLNADALRAARRMHEVIDTMTQLEALRSGTMQAAQAPVALDGVLRQAAATLQDLAAEREHAVTLDLPDAAVLLTADADRLEVVFTNVLKNALVFTAPDGTIQVRLSADAEAATVTITDSGLGLAERELERIFDEFYQVESYLTRTHEGLGLGLTLARHVVDLHGGRIWATSEGLGRGTTVHIQLPLRPAPTPISAQQLSRVSRP